MLPNPPAFPSGESYTIHDELRGTTKKCGKSAEQPGMTLRDYFAAKVLQALITKTPLVDQEGTLAPRVADKIKHNNDLADSAYCIADAMLARRTLNSDLADELTKRRKELYRAIKPAIDEGYMTPEWVAKSVLNISVEEMLKLDQA